MVGTGNLIWTAELDRELRSLVRKNTPTRTIANLLGLHRIQVIRRIKKLELTADNAGKKYSRLLLISRVTRHPAGDFTYLLIRRRLTTTS